MKKILTHEIEIKVPLVPNFLCDAEGGTHSIADFSEKELKEIGAQWLEILLERARMKKKAMRP